MDLRSGLEQLQLDLLPAKARLPPANISTVIGHGEFRRLLRQILRDDPAQSGLATPPAGGTTGLPARLGTLGTGSTSPGWSRPAQVDHAELAALEAAERQAKLDTLQVRHVMRDDAAA